MLKQLPRLSATAALAFGSSLGGAALAHHSIGGEFVNNEEVSVAGRVVEFQLINPHTYIVLEVEGQSDEPELWTLTYGPATKLIRGMGWTPATVSEGELLRATGRPARKGLGMYLSSLERADGTKLLTELIE